MTLAMPDAVRAFLARGNDAEAPPLSQCCTEDAEVHDEGGVHVGHDAIADWMRGARSKYDFMAEPLSADGDGEAFTVRARVTGRFPGSPIELGYVFRMAGDRISRVRID